MAVIEKLLVQIFERKSWIIDQFDQQSRLFDQHLASKLLIDGITPPPWLFHSDNSGFLLSSRPRPAVPFSYNHCSVYEVPVAETTGQGVPNGPSNKDFVGGDETSALVPRIVNDPELASVGVSTLDPCVTSLERLRDDDPSITSPLDERDSRIVDANHNLALSLARLQRSRSRQRDLEIRKSVKKVHCEFGDDTNQSGYSGRRTNSSAVPSFQDYELEDLSSANPIEIPKQGCPVEDVKTDGPRRKENGGVIGSGRVTRSKSSARQQSVSNAAHSSLTGTASLSLNRSDFENRSSKLVHLWEGCDQTHGDGEALVGEKRKAIWSGADGMRITRSRSTVPNGPTIDPVAEAVQSNVNKQLIPESIFAASSRSTRSRSKVPQGPTVEPVAEAVQLVANKRMITESIITTSDRLCIREDEELCAANSSDNEIAANEFVQRNTRALPTLAAEVTLKPFGSQDLGRRITRSVSVASHKPLQNKLFNSFEVIGGKKVSSFNVRNQPSIDTSGLAELEGQASTLKEAKVESARSVEAHSISSGPHMNNAEAAELEVLAPFCADSSIPVEPRQLDFDGVETLDFDGVSTNTPRNKAEKLLEERKHLSFSESTGFVALMSDWSLENHSLHEDKKDDLSVEEESKRDVFEAGMEESDTAIAALSDHAVSAEKETSCAQNDTVSHDLQQSDKRTNMKSSLTGVTMYCETDTGSHGTALPSPLVSKDDTPETSAPVDCKQSNDVDFSPITKPDHLGDQGTDTDLGVELPCAETKDENVEQELEDLVISLCRTAVSLGRSTLDGTNVDRGHSSQSQIVAKSEGNYSSGSSLGGPLTQSTWKPFGREDIIQNSAEREENFNVHKHSESRESLSEEKAVTEMDSETGGLLREEPSPKGIVESQDLQIPQEDALQLDTNQIEDNNVQEGSESSHQPQLEEVQGNQIKEQNFRESFESSLKLLVEEPAEFSLQVRKQERNTSISTPFTFEFEEFEATLGTSAVRQAIGDREHHLTEEATEADPTNLISGGDWQRTLDKNDDSIRLAMKSLSCIEALMHQNKCDLAGTGKFSYDTDDTMPVLEGFILQSDDEQPHIANEEIRIENLNLPKSAIERAGILEKLCKSACMQTPVSYSSDSCKLNTVSNLYQSVPTGLLEGLDVKNKHPVSEEFSRALQGRPHSDSFWNLETVRNWDIKKPCLSPPVQKVWERIILKSSSSEKRKSLSLELPCINEESENIEEVVEACRGMDLGIMNYSAKREPLSGINENLPVSEAEPYIERFSLNSVNTEFSFNGTHNGTKNNLENSRSIRRRYDHRSNKENESLSSVANSRNGKIRPVRERFSKQKLSVNIFSRKGGPGSTEMEPKRNNIVSNITSFIPLVQQKQAAMITTGKRDVKVKALEAAEAAKRLAEKKENERKIKKEAMKLERARAEQESLKQLELQKKRKEEERKRKEADLLAKKRLREEEEKKEKERKRLRVEETRKQQKENEQRLLAAKEEKDKSRTMVEKGHVAKESKDEKLKYNMMEKVKEVENVWRISETGPTITQASTSEDRASQKKFEASSDLGNNLKPIDKGQSTGSLNWASNSIQEPSYDISPYKCSEDEDEDEDDDEDDEDVRPRKFIPSWASKKGIASVLSQDGLSPSGIFPRNSFCSISEAVLPRRLDLAMK